MENKDGIKICELRIWIDVRCVLYLFVFWQYTNLNYIVKKKKKDSIKF